MSDRPPAPPRRLVGALRAHPRRTALALAVLALVLTAAVVLVVRAQGSPPPAASSATGRAGAPTTGRPGSDPGSSAGGSGAADPTTTGGPGGPGTSAGPGATGSPAKGTRPGSPGVSPVDGGSVGDAPVALRPPVRCPATGAPRTGTLPSVDPRDGRQWVTVQRLTGSCDASSGPFHLRGIDTRLAWRSDADSFAVFVVDVRQGRDASAGFADAQCAGPCAESQPLVPGAGDYTLEVQAGAAPWEVEIQEYRQP